MLHAIMFLRTFRVVPRIKVAREIHFSVDCFLLRRASVFSLCTRQVFNIIIVNAPPPFFQSAPNTLRRSIIFLSNVLGARLHRSEKFFLRTVFEPKKIFSRAPTFVDERLNAHPSSRAFDLDVDVIPSVFGFRLLELFFGFYVSDDAPAPIDLV